jgi:hypothetical protein
VGGGRYPYWTGRIRPFRDSDVEIDVIFYQVPASNPSCYPTVFTDRFWDDKDRWLNLGVGTVSRSMRPLLQRPLFIPNGPIVGTPDQFINGLSYEAWLAGAYPAGQCIPYGCPSLLPTGGSLSGVETATANYEANLGTGSGTTASQTDSGSFVGQAGTGGKLVGIETATAAYAGVAGTGGKLTALEGWGFAPLACTCGHLSGTEVITVPLTSFNQNSISASGTTQGTATAVGDDQVYVTNANGHNGVILPSGPYRILIANVNTSNSLLVYPPVGGSLSSFGENNPVTLGAGNAGFFIALGDGCWAYVEFSCCSEAP